MAPPRQQVEPQTELHGRVLEWKGSFGWLECLREINHPEAHRHKRRIFLHRDDCKDQEQLPRMGSVVTFSLYEDKNGLGAQSCSLLEVVRLRLVKAAAEKVLGESGDKLDEFETETGVALRAYEWCSVDPSVAMAYPSLLVEAWAADAAALSAALLRLLADDEALHLLVPEGRVEQVKSAGDTQTFQLSDAPVLLDPMPCHEVSIGAADDASRTACEAIVKVLTAASKAA